MLFLEGVCSLLVEVSQSLDNKLVSRRIVYGIGNAHLRSAASSQEPTCDSEGGSLRDIRW